MINKAMNPPSLPPELLQILGLSLEDARSIASAIGYRVEVLIPKTKVNIWGEEEETGWVMTPSSYAPDKINVALDENGNVSLISY
jgi:hypothetical protein